MILRDRFENLFQFILFRLGSNNYFLKKSRNVLYFDSNRLKQVRRRKLKKVLWEAVNYVPYYRSMKLNIDWKNFTEKELDKFPIVDKQTILDNLGLQFTIAITAFAIIYGIGNYVFKTIPREMLEKKINSL